MIHLEVNQYDELYKEVQAKYPNTPEETLHEITITLYNKMQNDRKQYADTYNRTNNQKEETKDQLETLNDSFHDFMKETRSYRTWTTRYRGPSI